MAKDHLGADTLARCIRYLLDRRAASELLRQREAELAHVSRIHTVSEMASAIVHELTAPLHVVNHLAEASLRRIQTGDIAQVARNTQTIVEEVSRASETIQRLRNFIRHGKVQHAPVSMESLVREALRLVEREARHDRF